MRRKHNYDDFLLTFLTMLAQQGKLVPDKKSSSVLSKSSRRAKAKKRK